MGIVYGKLCFKKIQLNFDILHLQNMKIVKIDEFLKINKKCCDGINNYQKALKMLHRASQSVM